MHNNTVSNIINHQSHHITYYYSIIRTSTIQSNPIQSNPIKSNKKKQSLECHQDPNDTRHHHHRHTMHSRPLIPSSQNQSWDPTVPRPGNNSNPNPNPNRIQIQIQMEVEVEVDHLDLFINPGELHLIFRSNETTNCRE